MIKRIEIKNFKTLRDVTIPLAPRLTVMVGANNSGKSNALAVLRLLRELPLRGPAEAIRAVGGPEAIHPRPGGGPLELTVTADIPLTDEPSPPRDELTLQLGRDAAWSISSRSQDPVLGQRGRARFRQLLSGIALFDPSPTAIRSPSLVQRGAKLGPEGQNAAAALDALAGERPDVRDAIEAEVRRAIPDVRKLLTRPGDEPGTKVLGVEERSGAVLDAEELSDGLLLFIGLSIAAQLAATQRSLIAIEQPERGLHPRRLRDLLDQLLRVTENGTQIVLTTHSPTLLDELQDFPESVLVFDRDEGGTRVTRLTDKREWIESLEGGPLGDIWYSGIVGGVPRP